MKTTKIKSWDSFNTNESDADLLSDLETLGVSEKSWTLEQIQEAFRSCIDESEFAGGSYADVTFSDDYSWKIDELSDECKVEAYFEGTVSFDIDSSAIASAIIRLLEKEPRISTDEDKWEAQEIRDAIEDVDFASKIEPDYNDLSLDFSSRVYNEGISVTASVEEDSLGLEMDEDGMWDEMETALEAMK